MPEWNPLTPQPLLTADLPGIGGRIKSEPEDFEVEEIPAYPASGQGEFLYLWIEKRGMGAEYFQRQIARRLGLGNGDIGVAGLKDRHAVTRQMISVPSHVEERLKDLDGDGIQLLKVDRHSNKLRSGHLHGNRFRILVRDPAPSAGERLPALLERLRDVGLLNYYGTQRFGRDGETLHLGLKLLRGEKGPRNPFLRKLALSAVQSALFNTYLAKRLADGLIGQVVLGDVMSKRPFGGMFTVEDVAAEQERFTRRETIHTGPMFGKKMFPAKAEAEKREHEVLSECGFSANDFSGFGKLLQGTRRLNLVPLDDLSAGMEADGIRLSFTLPSGSYATILLEELTKNTIVPTEEDG